MLLVLREQRSPYYVTDALKLRLIVFMKETQFVLRVSCSVPNGTLCAEPMALLLTPYNLKPTATKLR